MKTLFCIFAASLLILAGCAGHQTVHHLARSSDTVSIGAGWMHTFSRDSIRITVTDYNGTQTVYNSGDPAIRGIINMYIDPVSNIALARETGIDHAPYSTTYANQIDNNYTGGDADWWQTVVFLDLPSNMAVGNADILIESLDPVSGGVIETATATVEIVSGVGEPNPFSAKYPWGTPFNLNSDHMKSLERAGHYQIDFTGTDIPAALMVEMTHDPDIDNGGTGRAFVVNPTGGIKNIHWHDDGVSAKAIILPTTSSGFSSLVDCKFYVGGDVQNLIVSSVKAYDQDGYELSGVSASVTER